MQIHLDERRIENNSESTYDALEKLENELMETEQSKSKSIMHQINLFDDNILEQIDEMLFILNNRNQ